MYHDQMEFILIENAKNNIILHQQFLSVAIKAYYTTGQSLHKHL